MMQLRMPARLLASAGALVLAATLSSCGFDYATDREYTPTAGVNDRDAQVDVLSAVIVADHDGEGAFVASFANNDQQEPITVESLAGAGETTLTASDFSPVDIAPGQLINLATDGGVTVTGDFGPGSFVAVKIGFDNGENVEMSVPVVAPCDEFEGLAPSASGSTSGESYDCDVPAPATEH
ncbi:MAG: hypothetical protein HYU55_15905 [Nocardioides sp.]|nr:hypothetical protein [Nocardioides sp.]